MQVSILVDRARKLILDSDKARWSDPELLDYCNEGRRKIAQLIESSNPKTVVVNAVQGARQALPTDGLHPISVNLNMGTDGATKGDALREVDKSILDRVLPQWMGDDETDDASEWMRDALHKTVFYLSPPNTGNGYFRLIYSALPADAVLADELDNFERYEEPLVNYIVYRALSEDSDSVERAENKNYYNLFLSGLGLTPKTSRRYDGSKE
jgi:uncharacterized protein DUF6682